MKILDLEGVKSLIAEIKRRLSLKQDAEPGKQLSEENFTAEDKEKLESIPEMQKLMELLVNPKSFELIEEITINEEGISEIKRTEEPDGTVYDFEKVFIEVELSDTIYESENVGIRGYTNWSTQCTVYWTFSEFSKYASSLLEIKNGLGFALNAGARQGKTNTGQIYNYGAGFGAEATNVSTIRIVSGKAFPLNSTIKIYAVRR